MSIALANVELARLADRLPIRTPAEFLASLTKRA
jgi:hypothetical protein